MTTIKASRESLLAPLHTVIGIVEKRQTQPILSNVLVEIEGNRLTYLATDLEVQVTARIQLENAFESGQFTLSARKLFDILKSLPEDSQVAFDVNDGKLQVRCGKSRFSVQTLSGENFPTVSPSTEEGIRLTLSQKTLKSLLEKVQYAMAQQDVRYYLNGTLVELEGDQLVLVATDGHRMSYAAETLPEKNHPRIEVILPRKSVSELIKLLTANDEPVHLTVYSNQIKFEVGSTTLLSKVIDGKFPDYTRVLPVSYHKHVNLNRPVFLQALQRASILSNDKIRGVRLILTVHNLALVCSNTEQEEAREDIDVDYLHDPLDIGFNLTYLLDVLNHLTAETITCSFGDVNSSVLVTVPGSEAHFKYVVMPMRI